MMETYVNELRTGRNGISMVVYATTFGKESTERIQKIYEENGFHVIEVQTAFSETKVRNLESAVAISQE